MLVQWPSLYKLNLHITITLLLLCYGTAKKKLSYMMTTPSLCEFFFDKKRTYKAQRFVGLKELIYHFVFLHLFQHKIGSFQTKSRQAKPSPATTVGSSCHFWTLTVLNNSCKHCRLFMSVCLSGDLARIENEWKKCLSIYTGIYRTNGRTDGTTGFTIFNRWRVWHQTSNWGKRMP